MAWLLNSETIRAPHSFNEGNNTQEAQIRTLDGTISRDHFGSNKRVWRLEYNNTNVTDFNTIDTIYQAYLADSNPVTFEVTDTNYTISQVNVHVDLAQRSFGIRGESFLSDFTLVLTEA